MKQEVDVMAVFEQGNRNPRPIKFRLIENGINLTVDVFQVLGSEHIGTRRLDYECNSLSSKGNLLVYKLQYYREDGRWVIEK